MENIIVYGILISLGGLLLSALVSVFPSSSKASGSLMAFANLIGFSAGVAYFASMPGKEIIIAGFGTLLGFKFTIGYLSAVFFTLVNGVACLVSVFGHEYLRRYADTYDTAKVLFLTALFIFGMSGAVLASNPIGFMIFWELMSIASFFLVMADRKTESARAAFIYFIMTHLGAAAILGGFLVLGGGSLSYDLSDLALMSRTLPPELLSLSFVLFFFGFGSKAGLIPFHIWLPEAHPQAPTNISALMSGLMLKIAVYGFLRTVFVLYHLPLWAGSAVLALGIVSAFFGALYAAVEKDIKRAFAYSSIENMGIIFTMLGTALFVMSKGVDPSLSGAALMLVVFAVFHSVNHAVFKTGLFLSSGVIINKVHSKSLEAMGGIAKAMPLFSGVFLLIILASAALPPLGTFYGEWGFIRSLVGLLHISGLGTSSLAVLLAILPAFALVSGLAIFAMIKIYAISMLGLPRTNLHDEEKGRGDMALIAPLGVLGLATVVLGVFAQYIIESMSAGLGHVANNNGGEILSIAISTPKVFIFFLISAALSYAAYRVLVDSRRATREYHTWDCGQPIDASMEYTATAFSGPIRFFFLALLKREKNIVSVPVVASNPWIAKKSFSLAITSVWEERFYKPAAKAIMWLAEKIRFIHTGRIQYYLLLLLLTIIITLIVAL